MARRAANLIVHELAPERTVRVCHGGLLETSGGMHELVERADKYWRWTGAPWPVVRARCNLMFHRGLA